MSLFYTYTSTHTHIYKTQRVIIKVGNQFGANTFI